MGIALLVDTDALQTLVAGWLSGAAIGLVTTPVATIVVLRSGRWAQVPEQRKISPVALGIVAANGMMIGWTLIGLILGAVYLGTGGPWFSAGVVAGVLAVLAAASIVRGRLTWPMWSTAIAAVLGFALMLPFLAELDV